MYSYNHDSLSNSASFFFLLSFVCFAIMIITGIEWVAYLCSDISALKAEIPIVSCVSLTTALFGMVFLGLGHLFNE